MSGLSSGSWSSTSAGMISTLYCIESADRDWGDYHSRPTLFMIAYIAFGARTARWNQMDLVDMKCLLRLQRYFTSRQWGFEDDFAEIPVCDGSAAVLNANSTARC